MADFISIIFAIDISGIFVSLDLTFPLLTLVVSHFLSSVVDSKFHMVIVVVDSMLHIVNGCKLYNSVC